MTKKVKRSIAYDEIRPRLGRGRKTKGVRDEVHSPAGTSVLTKRVALEWAKMVVLDRHFAEVREVFAKEVEFLNALDEWVGGEVKASEQGFQALLVHIRSYYEAHGIGEEKQVAIVRSVSEPTQPAMLMPSGRPRPRPKKQVG